MSSCAGRGAASRARFVHADLTTLELDEGSVDAVASFYALNHVPRELLAGSSHASSAG